MSSEEHGKVAVAGHLTGVKEHFHEFTNMEKKDMVTYHNKNMGEMIEANEKELRGQMKEVYI